MMQANEEVGHSSRERRPYWKRAHHDWRFWVAFGLMLAAMFIYLMTDDLSIVPHIRTRAAQSGITNGAAR